MEKKKDFERFSKLMRGMEIAMGKETSRDRVELYFKLLEDMDIETLEKVFIEIIKTEKYPTIPTIGKIRSIIEGEREDILEDEANVAWQQACKLVWHLGADGGQSGDHILDEAVQLAFGGWRQFGKTDKNYETGDRKHFMNCYKGIINREKREALKPADIRKQLKENREKLDK